MQMTGMLSFFGLPGTMRCLDMNCRSAHTALYSTAWSQLNLQIGNVICIRQLLHKHRLRVSFSETLSATSLTAMALSLQLNTGYLVDQLSKLGCIGSIARFGVRGCLHTVTSHIHIPPPIALTPYALHAEEVQGSVTELGRRSVMELLAVPPLPQAPPMGNVADQNPLQASAGLPVGVPLASLMPSISSQRGDQSAAQQNSQPATPGRGTSASTLSPRSKGYAGGVTKSGKRRRRHPVAEIKGGWTLEEDTRLKQCAYKPTLTSLS